MQTIRTWWAALLCLTGIILVLSIGSLSAEEDSEEQTLPVPTDVTYTVSAEGILLEWTGVDLDAVPAGMTLQEYVVEFQYRRSWTAPELSWSRTAGQVSPPETSLLHDGTYHDEYPRIVCSSHLWYALIARYQNDEGTTFDAEKVWLQARLDCGSIGSVALSEEDGDVQVTWTAPSLSWSSDAVPVSAYSIVRLTMAEGPGYPDRFPDFHVTGSQGFARLDATTLSFQDNGVDAGGIYSYYVIPRFGVFQGPVTFSDDVIVLSQAVESVGTSEE